MDKHEITKMLKKEMAPALGCTAPTAYALATACCKALLTAQPNEVKIYVSPALLKLGFGVATPGTTQPGIAIAAAIGLAGGDYKLGMQVLKPCTGLDVEKAHEWVNQGLIQVLCDSEKTGIYVRAEISTSNEKAIAVVENEVDWISSIEVNGEKKLVAPPHHNESATDSINKLCLEDIFAYINTADTNELTFLLDGYRMNLSLAEDGIKQELGLKSGRAFLKEWWTGKDIPQDLFEKPMIYMPNELSAKAKILVAAASDARMGGSRLPAMAAMGDGNQGITSMIPVGVAAELLGKSDEETIKALALSCLMLFYVKQNIGHISALCMCAIAASGGVVAGVSYLRGISEERIRAAVKNMISSLCGMLCDGAKNACAFKMSIATTTALSFVDLATSDVECGFFDGVSDDTLEQTVACISSIAIKSTEILDDCMVDEILKKTERRNNEILAN